MRCPFLREAQVKFCQASPFRKMIVRTLGQPDHERCSSPDYVNCPAAKQHHEDHPSMAHCPFLTESLVQYCSAAAVTKFIPYSESALSRCTNDSHRYCELYVALAHAQAGATESAPPAPAGNTEPRRLPVPEHLYFAANHMWIDLDRDGSYHLGVDAFFATVFGNVEAVSFMTTKSVSRPAAVLTVQGVDLQMVFPIPLLITRANVQLRSHPERLAAEPYSLGWLFEGTVPRNAHGHPDTAVTNGLRHGQEAQTWMQHECDRMSLFVHEQLAHHDLQGQPLLADGGAFSDGFARHLNREKMLHLFNEFFSPYAGRSNQS